MMRRKRIALGVDGLELRTLLSGITYTLTIDQSTYQVGQPIQMTFTETNTSDQPVTVALSPTDFSISEKSPLWQSNPENAGQPPTSVTLQPGQSVSQTATWDGTIPETSFQQGTSTSVAVNQFGTFTVSNPNAPQGDTATFQITDPLQGALTTNQTTYQVGQPVQLTYTETNTSDQTLTIVIANPLYQILHNGQPILPVMDPVYPSFVTITPGQTITNQYTYQPPSVASSTPENLGSFVAEVYDVPAEPGEFTADFQVVSASSSGSTSTSGTGDGGTGDTSTSGTGDGGSSSTSGTGDGGSSSTGQLAPPIDATVTTNHADYQLGESVRIHLKIPGTGVAKAAAPPAQSREEITVLDGTQVVARMTHRIPASAWKHLETGRTVTLTTSRDGRPNQPGVHRLKPGSYTIDVAYGEYGGSTVIALGRKGS